MVTIAKLQEYAELLEALKEYTLKISIINDSKKEFKQGQYQAYLEAISILNYMFKEELQVKL